MGGRVGGRVGGREGVPCQSSQALRLTPKGV